VILPAVKGTSPGRAATGIRVVDAQGRAPGPRMLLRVIVAPIVDWFPYFLPLVGVVTMFATKRNQRVGDMASGTFTVRKEAAGQPVDQGAFAPGVATGPGLPQQPQAQPAGWYPDPQGQAGQRYWDGASWTEHTSA
jgi:hypothetical protein